MRIAFAGRARRGKNEAANVLLVQGYTELRFSDRLYEVHNKVYEMLDVPVQKNGNLLQLIGTDIGRSHDPDIWLKYFDRKLNELPADADVVCTDVRFENEVEFLKSRGFKVVGIYRMNAPPSGRNDNHPSETALDWYEFDYTIHNDGTIEELHAKVLELTKE